MRLLSRSGTRLASLSDHDTMWGFPCFFEACLESGILALSGIELTCWLGLNGEGEEVHLLGYGLKWSEELEANLISLKEERNAHQKLIVGKLRNLGYELDFGRLELRAGKDPIMVSHILWEYLLSHPSIGASLLLTSRLRKWVNDFLSRITGPGGLAYIPPPMSFEDGAKFIRRHEGVVVLAHPSKILNAKISRELLNSDIDGIEVFYPGQEKITDELVQYAKRRNLLITGGTDWHGYFSGAYPGSTLPLEFVNGLLGRLELPPISS